MSKLTIGKKVKLIGMSSTKIYLGDNNSEFICHGYCTGIEVKEITIDACVGTALISKGRLYPLEPEGHDDYYAVVIEK